MQSVPLQLKDTYWALCLPPTVGVGSPALFSKSQEAYFLFFTRLILQILVQSLCLRASEREKSVCLPMPLLPTDCHKIGISIFDKS